MMTSRPVLGRSGHHITFNEDDHSTVADQAGHYEASVFDVVHDAGHSTAFYSSKSKLNLLDRSWDENNGAPDKTGADNGRDKIDTYVVAHEPTNVGRLLRQLRGRPATLSFVHLAYPDSAGHRAGFMSDSYLQAVRRTDDLLRQVVAAIRANSELSAHLDLIVTADHGGRGPGHDNPRLLDNYRIPFMVWGPQVRRGADLYDLNRSRKDPRTSRPTYTGAQPIRNGEVGNLVTQLLGLPAIPGSVFDVDHDLRLS